MPYKSDGSDVPKNASGLSASKRRKWAAIWNSVYGQCVRGGGKKAACEKTAYAQANVTIKEGGDMTGFIAQKPTFEGIQAVELKASELTFEVYRAAYYERTEAEETKTKYRFSNAPKSLLEWIGEHFLLINDQGVTFAEMFAFPVVAPDTGRLSAPQLLKSEAMLTDTALDAAEDDALGEIVGELSLLCEDGTGSAPGAVSEIEGSVIDFHRRIRMAFIEAYAPATKWTEHKSPTLHILDLLYEDSLSGNMLIVLYDVGGITYGVPYVVEGAEISFAQSDDWKPVVKRWEIIGGQESAPESENDKDTIESFAELDAPIIRLVEDQSPVNRRSPLTLEVAIIKVGPGNKRDKHFYGRQMLERDGHVFEGVTMHVVDHREDQRSERTDVSTVKKVTGVTEMNDGEYLLAEVLAYDPDFCEKTRNRADAGLLDKLQCSILAMGESKKEDIGGTTHNVVQRITEARHVDWVTRAGAGGHALTLAETEPEEKEAEEEVKEDGETTAAVLEEEAAQQTEPDTKALEALDVVKVIEVVAPHLPATSLSVILAQQYMSEADVRDALAAEIQRLKDDGSGAPIDMGEADAPEHVEVSYDELAKQLDKVNAEYLGG